MLANPCEEVEADVESSHEKDDSFKLVICPHQHQWLVSNNDCVLLAPEVGNGHKTTDHSDECILVICWCLENGQHPCGYHTEVNDTGGLKKDRGACR